LSSEDVPGDGNPVLVDKYNYLKIENVFQGRLLDTKELFSFEVAVATFQTNVTADFFIKAIYEIEADLVSEISTLAVDTTSAELTTIEGRKVITDRIMDGLNDYLVKNGYNPDIHYVYIINYNII
jgi:flagellar basal body-associated protein FliL